MIFACNTRLRNLKDKLAQPTMYICWVQDKETNTSTLLAVHCRPTDNYQNSSSSSYSRMSHVCQPLQILPVFIITQQHNLMALHKDNIQCIPLTYSRHFLYYYHGLKTSRKWKIEKQDNTGHVKKIWWFWKKWFIKIRAMNNWKLHKK